MKQTRQELKHLPAFIYVLEDPRDLGNLRYIGQTIGLPGRWHEHRQAATRTNHPKHALPLYAWWRRLTAEGIVPLMRILWQGDQADAEEMEQKAIAGYRALGMELFNLTDGGAGVPGLRHPNCWNRGLKGAQVAWNKGTKTGKSSWNAGKACSAEAKARISAKWTPERRAAQAARMHSLRAKGPTA